MKKLFTILTLFLAFCSFTFAKSSGDITGKILDPEGEPVSFANVILNSAIDSTMYKAEFSDENGEFLIRNVKEGNYWLTITFVGLPNYNSEPFSLNEGEGKDFGEIQMTAPDNELEEVTVVASRPILEIKPDKIVFNVDGSINATGNNGMELLRKSPGVVVDNNDNVLLAGKNGVRIYINGKPSPLQGSDLAAYLKSMQSDEIDAIEIITNPNSKFDAEGNAGIINIRLKKDKRLGANGNINLGYSRGEKNQYTGSINGNYRNKVFNAFGRYGYGDYENTNFFNMYRRQPAGTYDQMSRTESASDNNNFKAGIDFFLNKNHTLGFIAEGNLNDRMNTTNSITAIASSEGAAIDSFLVASGIESGERSNFNYNINYRFDNQNGKVWNMDADYGIYQNESSEFQPNTYMDAAMESKLHEVIFSTVAPTDIKIATFKIDHERNIGETKMGAGIKLANVVTDNVFDFYNVINNVKILNDELSNQFEYTENVNAAYVNLNRTIKKFGLSAGLRAEQTNSLGVLTAMQVNNNEEVDTSYFNIFPSAGITYSANQKNSFQLTYSRRIKRPSYQDLNPFVGRIDELVYSQGNPFLRPEYSNNLQLTHTFNYRFNTSFGYSRSRDLITRITNIGEDEKSAYITWLNLATQDNFSLTFSAPIPITKWWDSFTNINAYQTHNKADYGDGRIVDLKVQAIQVYGQHTFKLPKDISFEVSGWWSSPSIWGGTFETEQMYSIDCGVQKKLFDGKGNIKLSLSDIFKSNSWAATSLIGDLYQSGSGGWDSRRFRINFSYRFGNDNVKSRKRNTGLEDEGKRVKS